PAAAVTPHPSSSPPICGGTRKDGTLEVKGLATAGTYEARAILRGSAVVSGRSAPFTVAANVTTDAASYTVDQPIIVGYSGLPGMAGEFITIAAGSTTLNSFRDQQATTGTSGSLTVNAYQIG